ncbi:MAG: DUF499 domain-containing protein [Candidatus Theseobacter exili]|nr:DUF499 domain-containing protein [Candidatus Theseobacter exili]
MNLKAWREVISPHQDVLEGSFQEAEFAADISKVVKGTATKEYQDPVLFFERTYITEGMALLLNSLVKRLAGIGGDPVIQLKTAFGGGKTHAMLSAYHLVKREKPFSELAGISKILNKAKINKLPKVRVAVIDGNALSPSQPRKYGSFTINTLWGELAWQIGGEKGYKLLAQADKEGTSPGKEILTNIFKTFAPVVVLMDETVAYIRQFEAGKSYAGGTFESNLTFIQALTEAAGHEKTACVLATLPESDMEAGGERGKLALKSIEHIFHRLEAIWKPVATEEGFEIVRRRLFSKIKDEKSKNEVCNEFANLYIGSNGYPPETKESSYYERLQKAYPIHPEVFDRLYEDWATLENFQRTRGVLRLMAMVLHRLWSDGNKDLMIMPSSFPLYDVQILSELIRYLPQGWEPVVERDVDGTRSLPTRIDETNSLLGSVQAARRVARSVFLGSAPSMSGQKIRGINTEHIRLACCQPGQKVGRFDDAIRHLNDQLHYMYSSNDRYWYDTQTNLRREAEDRMSRFNVDEYLLPELKKRLGIILRKNNIFSGVHIFSPHEDIIDDTQLRLVVLPLIKSHIPKEESMAIIEAREFITKRGNKPRLNQNRLIFLVADETTKSAVYDQTKRYLAWQSILADKDALNLDQHRIKEATRHLKEADNRLIGALGETYKWLLSPHQEKKKQGLSDIQWEENRVPTMDPDLMDSIMRKLKDSEIVIPNWAGIHLSYILDEWYLKDDNNDVIVSTLWNDFCRYIYLPRLVDESVLIGAIADGIQSQDFFAYASGEEKNRYVGLKFGDSSMAIIDLKGIVVKKEAAMAQIKAEKTPTDKKGWHVLGVSEEQKEWTATNTTNSNLNQGKKSESRKKHFYGQVDLKPINATLTFDRIVREVIQNFSSEVGTDVEIKVEIEASSQKGFEESTQSVIEENSRALGFKQAEFEDE